MYLHCENIVVPTLLWSAGFECHVTMTVDVLYAMFICYQTSCLSSLPLSSRRFLSQDTRAYSANASGFKPIKPHCICTDALNQTEGCWTEEIILHTGSLKNYRNSSQCDIHMALEKIAHFPLFLSFYGYVGVVRAMRKVQHAHMRNDFLTVLTSSKQSSTLIQQITQLFHINIE